MKCAKCTLVSNETTAGLIHGLCTECTEEIAKKAKRRGIYLKVRRGESPPYSQRVRKIDGFTLWWWRGQWRTQ